MRACFGDRSPPSFVVRCVCTSRDSVLCARALLLHAALSYDIRYILGILVIFFNSRVLQGVFV